MGGVLLACGMLVEVLYPPLPEDAGRIRSVLAKTSAPERRERAVKIGLGDGRKGKLKNALKNVSDVDWTKCGVCGQSGGKEAGKAFKSKQVIGRLTDSSGKMHSLKNKEKIWKTD